MEIAPYMEVVNIASILKSIKDISCMALIPLTSDREEKLEAMMPELDIPDPKNTLAQAKQLGDLTKEQKELMGELFDELEVTHESLARASITMGRLSLSLNGKQLLLILRASVWPLVQINTLDKFWKDPISNTPKAELPDDIHQRVRLTMIPDPSADIMKKENFNSPMRLLAATLAFKEVRRQCNTEKYARSVQCAPKTTGTLYYWPQIPGHYQQAVQKAKSIRRGTIQ